MPANNTTARTQTGGRSTPRETEEPSTRTQAQFLERIVLLHLYHNKEAGVSLAGRCATDSQAGNSRSHSHGKTQQRSPTPKPGALLLLLACQSTFWRRNAAIALADVARRAARPRPGVPAAGRGRFIQEGQRTPPPLSQKHIASLQHYHEGPQLVQ